MIFRFEQETGYCRSAYHFAFFVTYAFASRPTNSNCGCVRDRCVLFWAEPTLSKPGWKKTAGGSIHIFEFARLLRVERASIPHEFGLHLRNGDETL